MGLQEILNFHNLINEQVEFGLKLRSLGITKQTLDQYPDLQEQNHRIRDEGKRYVDTLGRLEVFLGIYTVFLRRPIAYSEAQRYLREQISGNMQKQGLCQWIYERKR